MHEEDRLKQEAQARLSEICNLSFRLREEKSRVETGLLTLRRPLPEILTNAALGLIGPERAIATKSPFAECEESLSDFPLIQVGLEKNAVQAHRQLERTTIHAKQRQKYEALEAQLTEAYDPDLMAALGDDDREVHKGMIATRSSVRWNRKNNDRNVAERLHNENIQNRHKEAESIGG